MQFENDMSCLIVLRFLLHMWYLFEYVGFHSPVPKNEGVPNKRGGGLKNVLGQKWQPVITNYGCPKQLLIVEKHQDDFSCSLHLFIKQNRTFLITNISNVNTKLFKKLNAFMYSSSCSSCSISLTRCFWGILLNPKI